MFDKQRFNYSTLWLLLILNANAQHYGIISIINNLTGSWLVINNHD